MTKFMDKLIDIVCALLPFLRKKSTADIKEFSELVRSQYGFLGEQLEKALKDYFELSDRVKALHDEVIALRKQLAEALPACCHDLECANRKP